MTAPADLNSEWMYWMLRGEFERAWQLSDRLCDPGAAGREGLRGKRVLLRCEHGLGDTIQFIRYVRLVRPLAGRILVHAQPRLMPLIRTIPEIDFGFTWGEPWPRGQYDCEIEIMDLPHVFRTTLATVPCEIPYLAVDRARVKAKQAGFRRPGRFHVGLVWAAGGWDTRRSVPLAAFSGLKELPELALFSLQFGPPYRQMEACGNEIPFLNPGEPRTPHAADTAAEILSLDLVITVDTMVAHLAGALGKPVWVLLPRDANWRWMLARSDSPWYPTMRLFRQDERRDWRPVVESVIRELRRVLYG